MKRSKRNVTSDKFYIEVGRYNLHDAKEKSAKKFDVKDVIVHSEWNTEAKSFNCDIALIYLDSDIIYNDFVQPVCLPELSSKMVLDAGTIVGWGMSESSMVKNDHESMPKKVKVSAMSNELCFLTYPPLASLSSTKTFCAGGKNFGACKGDSGQASNVMESFKLTFFTHRWWFLCVRW
jgi:Trypsin